MSKTYRIESEVETEQTIPAAEEITETVEEPIVESKIATVVGHVNVSKLNVRKKASAESPVVKILENGEEVVLKSLNKKSGFYELSDGNFVMAEFITVQ